MIHSENPRLIGAPNFRELGGYPTIDGRHVRRQRVYRSDALSQLHPDDHAILDALPIQLVCDARSVHERSTAPNAWPAVRGVDQVAARDVHNAIEHMHLDVSNDLRAANKELSRAMLNNPSAEGAHAVMLSTYKAMPRAFIGRLAPVFDWLIATDRAMLVHCTAGKDRTGFFCAILLLALGVERQVVFDDYMLTSQRFGVANLSRNATRGLNAAMGMELDPAVLKVLSGVREDYLQAALETIETEFESLDNYLRIAAGMDAQRRKALQTALLE
jgi:protein-tyrosine phosphatase